MTTPDEIPEIETYAPPANPGEPPVGDAGPFAPTAAPLPGEEPKAMGLDQPDSPGSDGASGANGPESPRAGSPGLAGGA